MENVYDERTINDFIRELKSFSAKEVDAEKSECIIVTPAAPGDKIDVITADGNTEVKETAKENQMLTTAAGLDGKPILNENGQLNQWFVDISVLNKKYDMDNITPDGFVKPKGGIQHFIQTDVDVTIMKPWGENGALVPQEIAAGGWLNITNPDDVYGIAAEEFDRMYTVKESEIKKEQSVFERVDELSADSKSGRTDTEISKAHDDSDFDEPD